MSGSLTHAMEASEPDMQAFQKLWHFRAVTHSKSSFLTVNSRGNVADTKGDLRMSIYNAACVARDPAVSRVKLEEAERHLQIEKSNSESKVAAAIRASDDVCVRMAAVHTDPITRSRHILGEPEDHPLETMMPVLFVSLPFLRMSDAHLIWEVDAKDTSYALDGKFPLCWRAAVLAKHHLVAQAKIAESGSLLPEFGGHTDDERERARQALPDARAKILEEARKAEENERAVLRGDFARCGYQQVAGGFARILWEEVDGDPRSEALRGLPEGTRIGMRMKMAFLAEAAACLRCMKHGPALGPFPGEDAFYDEGFSMAAAEFWRADYRVLALGLGEAWAQAPQVPAGLERHGGLAIRTEQESERCLRAILSSATDERRLSMQQAMRTIMKAQPALLARHSALQKLLVHSRRVLATGPCWFLLMMNGDDVARIFADCIDMRTAAVLRKTCTAMRDCDAVRGRIPHVVFEKLPEEINNGILFGVGTALVVQNSLGQTRVSGASLFRSVPTLRMELLYDAPGYPPVPHVSGGSAVVLSVKADQLNRTNLWKGCVGSAVVDAPEIKIREGVSSHSNKGAFEAEMRSALASASNTKEREEARRMIERNSRRQLFRLRARFKAVSRRFHETEQVCVSAPFAICKKRYRSAQPRVSRAKKAS